MCILWKKKLYVTTRAEEVTELSTSDKSSDNRLSKAMADYNFYSAGRTALGGLKLNLFGEHAMPICLIANRGT